MGRHAPEGVGPTMGIDRFFFAAFCAGKKRRKTDARSMSRDYRR